MPNCVDPLHQPHLREPGIWESIKGLVKGDPKLFDVLQIEVCSACVAHCTYCPKTTMAGRWKNAFMEASTYANAWPLFRQARRVHLQGWGEPFLHRRFFDFVELARRADCLVSTTSCGQVLDEETALRLVGCGVDIIAFSLAGTNESTNRTRGAGTFSQTVEAIKRLQTIRKKRRAVHLEVHVAYMALASQIEDVLALPDLLDELDAHAAVVSTLDYIPSPEMAGESFMPWEKDKIDHARELLDQASAKATARGRELYYSLPVATPRATCLEHIERNLFISVDGAISPCIYSNLPTTGEDSLRRVFGNINDGAPLEAWQSGAFVSFRQGLATGTPDANCLNCPKRFAVGNRAD